MRKTEKDCDYCGKYAHRTVIKEVSKELYSSYGVFLCERCWVYLKAFHLGRKEEEEEEEEEEESGDEV